MLRKALQKLRLSQRHSFDGKDIDKVTGKANGPPGSEPENINPGTGSTGGLAPEPQTSAFLHLPVDIIAIITTFLPLRDRISLSLTTKLLLKFSLGLPGVSESPTPAKQSKQAGCIRRIHHRLLPPTQQESKNPSPSDYTCPYCLHLLCPPTCATALFLDATTGVFFPSNLYPVHTAKFFYAAQSPEYKTRRPLPKDLERKHWSCTPDSFEFQYATIWCEHHRCPRGLMSGGRNKHAGKRGRFGKERFLRDYEEAKGWAMVRALRNPELKLNEGRWLAGYKLLEAPSSAKDNEAGENLANFADVDIEDKMPVHEKFFFDPVCLHCFLPLAEPRGRYRPWFGTVCSCHEVIIPRNSQGGCTNCGIVSVKYRIIEVFDPMPPGKATGEKRRSGDTHFWLYLALECKISPPSGVLGLDGELSRLVPIPPPQLSKNPNAVSTLLSIVRGYDVIPLISSKIGIFNLPRPVLHQILLYLAHSVTDGESIGHALSSSFGFVKGWNIGPDKFSNGLAKEYMGDPWGRNDFRLVCCFGGGFI
ncbi:hypothetical protein ABW19_dt0204677 [Dactylella cylindrospora]|nr:hypothetical protein ABW19_dt0204677 [Dactylella cylindrospora]